MCARECICVLFWKPTEPHWKIDSSYFRYLNPPMIFLFFGSTLLLFGWIIPDCGESDAPFPLTNFAQPHRCHLMVNAPMIARPSPRCFASFNRAQFSTNFLPKANPFPLLSISMNVLSCMTCIFFVLFLVFCQWFWVLNGNF